MDLFIEISKALVTLFLLLSLILIGRKEKIYRQKGWRLIISGLTFVLFGLSIDIIAYIPDLNRLLYIGGVSCHAFLEKVVGYLLGLAMLTLGFLRWMPQVVRLNKAENLIKKYSDELELNVSLRTAELEKIIHKLEQEILERKKAQKALGDAQNIINSSPAVAFVWKTADGWPVEYCSDNVRKTFGYTAEEFISNTISYAEVVHPDDLDRVTTEIAKYSREGQEKFSHEPYRIITKEGNVKWVDDRTSICRNGAGEITHNQGVVLDITQRINAQTALRESEELYSNIVESMSDGILVLDQNFHYTHWNRSMERISKTPCAKVINSSKLAWELFPHLSEQGVDLLMKKAMRGETVHSDNIPYQLADGTSGFTSETFLPLKTDKGRIRGVVGIVRDITTKMQLETKLQQAQKMDAITELTGGIAHDFNNMLTSVIGYISFAQMNLKAGMNASADLGKAQEATKRLSDLAHKLLALSKGSSAMKKSIAVKTLLNRSLDLASNGSEIQYRLTVEEENIWIEADETQLNLALQNVLANARESMPLGGIIKVEVCVQTVIPGNSLNLKNGDYVKISIKDQGLGIPEHHLRKIFDPYFSTKERGTQKGMGLGLTLTHSIIKKHRGDIHAESSVDRGTEIQIYLPISGSPIDNRPTKPGPAEISESAPSGKKGKILLMDDEETLLDVTSKMLNCLGYNTDLAVDGDQAVRAFQEAKTSGEGFDAVILDLTVKSGMGGKETIDQLLEIDPDVVAFISSGFTNDPVMVDFKGYGFSGAIVKPFNMNELDRKLATVQGA